MGPQKGPERVRHRDERHTGRLWVHLRMCVYLCVCVHTWTPLSWSGQEIKV